LIHATKVAIIKIVGGLSAYTNKSNILKFEAENGQFKGSTESKNKNFSGQGYVRNFSSENNAFQITIKVPKTANYLISLIGANGHGPHGTSCAIRSAIVDGKDVGTFILEANGNWDLWTESNHILLPKLKSGEHLVQILFNPENKGFDNNMSFDTENKNDLNLDYINVLCTDFK
jgi:VCBS repeat-containing protein